ncbi:MAG TPA: hypothetical protein VL282_00765 [Tepidisphaeraceae bacterium]|jgi:hypothetical protein|nr:hypothetical protein [Tepidisphaeraceae bacterium]
MSRLRHLYLTILIVSCAFGLLVVRTHGDEKVELKINMPPGTSWTFQDHQDLTMNLSFAAGNWSHKLKQTVAKKLSGKAEVLEADATGRPTAMRITYDPDSSITMLPSPQAATQPSLPDADKPFTQPYPLAGQSVIVRQADWKMTTDLQGKVDPQVEQHLRAQILIGDGLPKHPVAVGESWEADPQLMAKMAAMDLKDTRIMTRQTLKELKTVAGRRVAMIDFMISTETATASANRKQELTGTSMVDLGTGRTLELKTDGKFNVSTQVEQTDPRGTKITTDTKNDGTIKILSQCTLTATK